MKITIDTQKDSPEDIKKAIGFLQGLTGKPAQEADIGNFMDRDENTEKKEEPDEGSFIIPY